MLRLTRRLAAFLLYLVVLLGSSACGGLSGPPPSDIGGLPLDPDERAQFDVEYFVAVEAATSECMAARGFEYLPRSAPYQGDDETNFSNDPSVGYGITTELLATITGVRSSNVPIDPNVAILRALSADEQALYRSALDGLIPVSNDATPDEVFEALRTDSPSEGCRQQSVGLVDDAMGIDRVTVLEYEDSMLGVVSDSRVVQAQLDWSICMAESGFEFPNDAAVMETISEEAFAVLNQAAAESGGRVDSPETLEALDRVRESEIAHWTADQACSVKLNEVVAEVRAEFSKAFAG